MRRAFVVFDRVVEVDALVPDTAAEFARGLSHRRTPLSSGRGMLFVFRPGSQPIMWMKDTHIALDMIFVGPSMRVLDILDAEPESTRALSVPGATMVLEMPRGWSRRRGVGPGSSVEIRR